MPTRNATILLSACLGACAPIPPGDDPAAPGTRPNVVLIVVDTLRADHADATRMPAVARLAADGVRFDEAFVHAPLTLPSHTALFTSQPPDRTGVCENGEALGDEVHLPAWLASHGYRTAAAVSLATLWPARPAAGLDRGFERFERSSALIAHSSETSARLAELTDALDERTPFFLFAHYADPHEPYDAHGQTEHTASVRIDGREIARPATSRSSEIRERLALGPGEHRLVIRAPEPFRVRRLGLAAACGVLEPQWLRGAPSEFATEQVLGFELGQASDVTLDLWLHDRPGDLAVRYEREVRAADRAVGALLDDLRRRGLYDDALIVFTSDHGEALGERDFVGHGQHLFDELLRVPLVIKPPRRHPLADDLAAARSRLVRAIDIGPTILELAGLPALPAQGGASILSAGPEPLFAATRPRRKTGRNREPLVALRDERYKLVYDAATDQHRLFDLLRDPAELRALDSAAEEVRPGWAAELERRGAGLSETSSIDLSVLAELAALGY